MQEFSLQLLYQISGYFMRYVRQNASFKRKDHVKNKVWEHCLLIIQSIRKQTDCQEDLSVQS